MDLKISLSVFNRSRCTFINMYSRFSGGFLICTICCTPMYHVIVTPMYYMFNAYVPHIICLCSTMPVCEHISMYHTLYAHMPYVIGLCTIRLRLCTNIIRLCTTCYRMMYLMLYVCLLYVIRLCIRHYRMMYHVLYAYVSYIICLCTTHFGMMYQTS